MGLSSNKEDFKGDLGHGHEEMMKGLAHEATHIVQQQQRRVDPTSM